jgi:hypothetical protein
MNWGTRFSNMLVCNWREKLVALVLAFLFWLLIKAQTERPPMPYWQQMPPPAVQLTPAPAPIVIQAPIAPAVPKAAEAPQQ